MGKIGNEEITAIIVSYNSGHIIGNCLQTLRAADVPAIIVDNASSDDSAQIATQFGAKVIVNSKNQGFGRANNIGANSANSKWLLFINPDLEIGAEAISALLKAAQKYENCGILGPRIHENDGRLFLQPRSLLSPEHLNQAREITPDGDCSVPFLSGACLMIRRELFNQIGGFDENIFLFYEDDDLCRKVLDQGLANIFVNGAIAIHGRGKSSRPQKGQVFKVRYHLAWSKIYISRKYDLPINAFGDILKNGIKYLIATLSFSQMRKERYGGSLFGAIDALGGKSAIKYEKLIP